MTAVHDLLAEAAEEALPPSDLAVPTDFEELGAAPVVSQLVDETIASVRRQGERLTALRLSEAEAIAGGALVIGIAVGMRAERIRHDREGQASS